MSSEEGHCNDRFEASTSSYGQASEQESSPLTTLEMQLSLCCRIIDSHVISPAQIAGAKFASHAATDLSYETWQLSQHALIPDMQ
jgi:hypothetical protein